MYRGCPEKVSPLIKFFSVIPTKNSIKGGTFFPDRSIW